MIEKEQKKLKKNKFSFIFNLLVFPTFFPLRCSLRLCVLLTLVVVDIYRMVGIGG